jgi:hypothetical protein
MVCMRCESLTMFTRAYITYTEISMSNGWRTAYTAVYDMFNRSDILTGLYRIPNDVLIDRSY